MESPRKHDTIPACKSVMDTLEAYPTSSKEKRIMKITINAATETKHAGFRDSAIRRITKTLARFSHRISRVNVTLTDENGPRGGVDKRCQFSLVMPGFGELATSALHENPSVAVTQASNRARRMVLAKLTRPQARRVRRHKELVASSTSHVIEDAEA
jgi:ribosome-associated translation inhibitor RaiA